MKLLLCLNCSDVVSLQFEHRECKCGKSGGKYVNSIDASYYGDSLLLGFHNGSIVTAVQDQCSKGDSEETFSDGYYKGQAKGREFLAFIVPKSASSIQHYLTKEEYDSEN